MVRRQCQEPTARSAQAVVAGRGRSEQGRGLQEGAAGRPGRARGAQDGDRGIRFVVLLGAQGQAGSEGRIGGFVGARAVGQESRTVPGQGCSEILQQVENLVSSRNRNRAEGTTGYPYHLLRVNNRHNA
ncbi:MAG: hypothetical protein QG608_3644 [Actinomycetota bacterium]|nr:hypothetical protein [Actinomycetota bacterium]